MPHAGGRPSKYRKEYAQMMIDFFNRPVFERSKSGKAVPTLFPTLERFAFSIGVWKDLINDWAHVKDSNGELKNPEFHRAYKICKDLQAAYLQEGCLAGTHDKTFGIFTAKNVLGWRDKIDHGLEGPDGQPLPPNVITIVSPIQSAQTTNEDKDE